MCVAPTAMKNSTMATLIATITLFTLLLSLVPRMRSAVSSRIMPAAGRLAMPVGWPGWLKGEAVRAVGSVIPKVLLKKSVK